MIEVPGYLADQLDKEAAEVKKKEEDVSRETSEEGGVDDLYVDPAERVLDPSKADASLLERMPGMGELLRQIPPEALDDKELVKVQVMIKSMTKERCRQIRRKLAMQDRRVKEHLIQLYTF